MLINIGVSFIVSCRKSDFFCMKMLIYLFILSSDVKLVISSYQWIITYQMTKLIYIYILGSLVVALLLGELQL